MILKTSFSDGIRFELPYPPSINSFYHPWRGRFVMSSKGKNYKKEVWALVQKYKNIELFYSKICLYIAAYPPDHRIRDLDNILKITLDSLKGILFNDDSNIDDLRILRKEVLSPNGKIIVAICEY